MIRETGPVCLVYLALLVYLVSFVQPNKRDRPDQPDRPNEQDRRAWEAGGLFQHPAGDNEEYVLATEEPSARLPSLDGRL